MIAAIEDFAPLFVIDLLYDIRRRTRRSDVRGVRLFARLRLQQLVGECDRLAVTQPVGEGRLALADRTEGDGGDGCALQQGPTIKTVRHVDPGV